MMLGLTRVPQFSRSIAPLLAVCLLGGACDRDVDGTNVVHAMHAAGRYQESIPVLEGLLESRRDAAELLYLYGVTNLGAGRSGRGEEGGVEQREGGSIRGLAAEPRSGRQ